MIFYLSTDAGAGVPAVENWLCYNRLSFVKHSFWDDANKHWSLDLDVEHCIVVWSHDILRDFLKKPGANRELANFLCKQNKVWIIEIDTAYRLTSEPMSTDLRTVNAIIPKKSMYFFLDARPMECNRFESLDNICFYELPYNFFMRASPRIQSSHIDKVAVKYDFLMVMTKKTKRPHRDILWHLLCDRPLLKDRGLCKFERKHESPWLGHTTPFNQWQDGHASMDLYLQCWLEVVAETCYDDLWFYTEKTVKPMVTASPFLVLSAPGYLGYLKNYGFRTFGNLIDEKYDTVVNLTDRARALIGVLHDICTNGAESFYNSSNEIRKHNFDRLCEISGAWQYNFDNLMWQVLEQSTT